MATLHNIPAGSLQSVQLSHDEFLMLLGFLRLPMPLALGADPLEEYTDEALDAALASATTSLMAREYVIELPADGAPPKLLPDLEELVGISALADGCLMAATQAGEQQTTAHYSIRAQQALVHTSPRERVHRLERLPSSGAIVDRLVDGIAPHATCAVPLAFSIEAEALGTAIDLANDGQAEAAAAALLEAGAPPEAADALRTRLGSRIARHALIAVRKLQSIHPLADSAAIIHGAQEDWFTEDDTTREGYVRVSTVDASVIRTRLDTLVASIMPTIA